MKLLSCHIENYGKFTNADFDFNSDIVSFCEQNGYGKSTLASFLKAMFYGLDTDRANIGFNERRHFCPFGGGNFGGYVSFSMQGKTYKIERYFDEKSETRDTVTVYCNGKVTKEFEKVGEDIFGIDQQSFERTIFISADEIDIKSTGSINTRLNNFLEGCDDGTNLSAAVARLEKKSKEYKKSRQGNDLITARNAAILKLSEEIANVRKVCAKLPEKYRDFSDYEEREKELVNEVTRAQTVNVVLKDWEAYDALTEELQQTRGQIKELEQKYISGIPSADDMESVSAAVERENALKARREQKLFTDSDLAKYNLLNAKFLSGVPQKSDFAEVNANIEGLTVLNSEIDMLGAEKLSAREESLKRRFANRKVSAGETEKLNGLYESYRQNQSRLEGIADNLAPTAEETAAKKPSFKKYAVLAAAFALVAAGGIAAVFFNLLIAGIVLISVGAAGLILSGFLFLNAKSNIRGAAGATVAENPEKAVVKKTLDGLTNQIQAILLPYGYSFEKGVAYAVAAFNDDVAEYAVMENRLNERRSGLEAKISERDRLENKISSFFGKYGYAGKNFLSCSAELKSDADTYGQLVKRREASAAQSRELDGEIAQNRASIESFAKKYGFDGNLTSAKIKETEGDLKEYNSKKVKAEELTAKAEKLIKEKSLTDRPQGSVDIKELNGRLAKLRGEKAVLMREIMADEYEAEKLDGLLNEQESEKQKLDEYRHRYTVLCKTIENLEIADRRLKDKYVKPVKDKFLYYSSLIEKVLGEQTVMDTDFEIRFVRGGKERSDKHLSAGQKSVCAFCFRLALLNNMYSAEKPFLILDDPFVNLDSEHFEKVKEIIKELQDDFQIIYFSCHNSRAI